jgi:DNA-binding CsgD family transcriptional regulator
MVALDLSCRDMDHLIGISRAFQGELPKDWLLAEPGLAKDLQTLFGADFIGSSRWDQVSDQFRDSMCIGRDPIMAADWEKEFQFCDPISPQVRRTGRPTLVRQFIDESVIRTRYWSEHRLHYDTVDGLEVHVMASGKEVGDLRLWRGKASPPFGDRERDMLRLLEPVLAGFFQRLGRRIPPSIEDRFPELTPREAQVASFVASGASDYVIGRRLGVSIWTVRTHLRHVFTKLDVPNRTALAGLFNRIEATAKADHDVGR